MAHRSIPCARRLHSNCTNTRLYAALCAHIHTYNNSSQQHVYKKRRFALFTRRKRFERRSRDTFLLRIPLIEFYISPFLSPFFLKIFIHFFLSISLLVFCSSFTSHTTLRLRFLSISLSRSFSLSLSLAPITRFLILSLPLSPRFKNLKYSYYTCKYL